MKRIHLSPVASLLVSLSLVVGILVSDVTGLRVIPKANAQTGAAPSPTVSVRAARLSSSVIIAKGVVINGVETNGVFANSVRVADAVVDARCGVSALGFNSAGERVYALGVIVSGESPVSAGPSDSLSTNGVIVSGELADQEPPPATNGVIVSGELEGQDETATTNGVIVSGTVYVGQSLEVSGGTVTGDVQVNNGVISGSSLSVVGAYVSSACGQ